jgi:hypothetical protein
MPRAAEEGRELIHDPGRDSGRELLGRPAGGRERALVRVPVGDGCERDGAGDLERGAGRETGAERNVRGEHGVHPDRRASELRELAHHRGDVPSPRGVHRRRIRRPVGRDTDGALGVQRAHAHGGGLLDRDDAGAVDRDG